MIQWQIGRVREPISERAGMQEVRVEMTDGKLEKALHDTTVHEPLQAGDIVWLNTTAVQLQLGTGGYHFVHAVIPRRDSTSSQAEPRAEDRTSASVVHAADVAGFHAHTSGVHLGDESLYQAVNKSTARRRPPSSGHMMKLKYTSLQRAVLAAEEEASPHHEVFLQHQSIDGTPVLIGELHSMLPIACAWLHHRSPELRIAYVMSDGGALPISLSRHVAALKQMSWLCGTVTYGQAYGGDLETMNKFTALIAARHILGADVIVVCMGPGIAGTGTPLGHTGTEAGELVNAVHRLGGMPIMMARMSGADVRPRHYGLSHHLLTNLEIVAACPAILPLHRQLPDRLRPIVEQQLEAVAGSKQHQIEWLERPQVDELESALHAYPLKISTMGRTVAEDPTFYMNVASAAEYAGRYLDHSDTHQA